MPAEPEIPEMDAAAELTGRVDELAVQLMLGNADQAAWLALLNSFRERAELHARSDLSRMTAECMMALSSEAESFLRDGGMAAAIEKIQSALLTDGAPAAADHGQSSVPSAAPQSESRPDAHAASAVPLSEDREMLADFILEARDHLLNVEVHIMTLERDPGEQEAINTVFRAFHTIKGLSAFLELNEMREVAHETETLLDGVRSGRMDVTSSVVDVVLAASDFLKTCLKRLELALADHDTGPAPEMGSLIERIRNTAAKKTSAPKPASEAAPRAAQKPAEPAPSADRETDRPAGGSEAKGRGPEARLVKVDTAKLDFLVEMAGEMVVAQSIVRHHPELAALRNPSVQRSLARLARITSDLQKTAMSMRMVPIGGLFQKMSRLVRDLARKSGKQAHFEAFGTETELDRNVVEELADPLMHMVRNAVDHGLESGEERRLAGKDATGHIRLGASHQAGHIVIEIADDGRGLVRENILAKARRKGLTEDGSNLSDAEVFNFIFLPGFSTAEVITDVSGRGVGMDVVRKQIQKLRGRVDIQSEPGRGTSFFLRLPLTLAMIDGLVVGVGAERYVIPLHSVREVLRPSEDMVFTVENRGEMALVRSSLLPIVRLGQRFDVEPRSSLATECLLIVAEASGKPFCLMVDDLIGKQEVVIKSLGETLQGICGVAGGAILGDGRVGLILDLDGVFRGERHV